MFSFIFRLISVSSFILGIFFCNYSFALPYDDSDKEYEWLKNHKFLVYRFCHCPTPFYKNLNNNRVLTLTSYDSINTISILGNSCDDEINLDYLYQGQVDCLNKTNNEFKDNKDEKVLKVMNLKIIKMKKY